MKLHKDVQKNQKGSLLPKLIFLNCAVLVLV